MNEMKKEASITVEAAFVIPIVLFVIFALVYLTFYLHDRVRTEEIVEKALGKGAILITQRATIEGTAYDYENINQSGNWGYFKASYDEQEKTISKYLEEESQQGFFLLDAQQITCETNGFSVTVKVKMKGKISINPVKNFWKNTPEFVLERSVPLHNPEEVLRQNKKLLEGAN